MEETQGVVGSAETGSPSRGTLASLREASTPLSDANCTTLFIKFKIFCGVFSFYNYKLQLL